MAAFRSISKGKGHRRGCRSYTSLANENQGAKAKSTKLIAICQLLFACTMPLCLNLK